MRSRLGTAARHHGSGVGLRNSLLPQRMRTPLPGTDARSTNSSKVAADQRVTSSGG
jgi:hypothetical protein